MAEVKMSAEDEAKWQQENIDAIYSPNPFFELLKAAEKKPKGRRHG